MEVQARRVEGGFHALEHPGDFYLLRDSNGKVTNIAFMCPCGKCGKEFLSALSIDVGDHVGKPKWQWDGNEDKPTLKPSILRRVDIAAHGDSPAYKCDWHGFLTAGMFKQC